MSDDRTPRRVENRPGLGALAYRVGERAGFFAAMLDRLDGAALGLGTRETDDASIAVLDAAAVMLDVATFYQERGVNEHYLRTATERRSLAGIAGLAGYRLSPGRAAETLLAFTIEPPPAVSPRDDGFAPSSGVPAAVTVPTGVRVQSVPGPGEAPAIFETVEPVEARAAFNAIPLRPRGEYYGGGEKTDRLDAAGFVTDARAGDAAFLVQSDRLRVTRIATVEPDAAAGVTRFAFADGAPPVVVDQATVPETLPGGVPSGPLDDFLWRGAGLASKRRRDFGALEAALRSRASYSKGSGLELIVLGASSAAFGHNAADKDLIGARRPIFRARSQPVRRFGRGFTDVSSGVVGAIDGIWLPPIFATDAISKQNAPDDSLYLDGVQPAAIPGRRILLQDGHLTLVARIAASAEKSLDLLGLRGRATLVTLDQQRWIGREGEIGQFELRGVKVSIETARIKALPPLYPADKVASGQSFELDGPYLGLAPGRRVVLAGDGADAPGGRIAEAGTIAAVRLVRGRTVIDLASPLAVRFVRRSVRINANVAPATHGETVRETVGSGDARRAFQRFSLRQGPVTWRSAAASGGVAPEIAVRVGGVAWTRVETLFEAGPRDKVFVLEIDADGQAALAFGDGVNGARLPTGTGNVAAVYRRGLGRGGSVGAGQLSLLLDRPLGVREVTNPIAAFGGGDPQTIESARLSAPFPLRTLGRIVSLTDYADFARAAAGVAKASADRVWNGRRWTVLITVAGAGGEVVPEGSQAFADLLKAMRAAGDPTAHVALAAHRPRGFTVEASLAIVAGYEPDATLTRAAAALERAFAFDARELRQPVYRSEVLAVLQGVEGVAAVDLNALRGDDGAASEGLSADGPALSGGRLLGAQLLAIAPAARDGLRRLA